MHQSHATHQRAPPHKPPRSFQAVTCRVICSTAILSYPMHAAGEGEFGVVHKATWYGTVVAAKILKNTSEIALGDFRAEIEVLRKVRAEPAWGFAICGADPSLLPSHTCLEPAACRLFR